MAVQPTQWITETLYPVVEQLMYEEKLVFSVEAKLIRPV
jgi:hypothetical protein